MIKKLNELLLGHSAKIIKKMGYSDTKQMMSEHMVYGMLLGGVAGVGVGVYHEPLNKKPRSIIKTAYTSGMLGSWGAIAGGVSAAALTLPIAAPRSSLAFFATSVGMFAHKKTQEPKEAPKCQSIGKSA